MRAKLITADAQITTTKANILGFILQPDGSNAATLVLHNEADDSKTASKRVAACRTPATESREVLFPKPMYCNEGIYADIGGTGAIAFILIE